VHSCVWAGLYRGLHSSTSHSHASHSQPQPFWSVADIARNVIQRTLNSPLLELNGTRLCSGEQSACLPGHTLAMMSSTHSGVMGPTYVRDAVSGSVMMVACRCGAG